MSLLDKTIAEILPVDRGLEAESRAHLDNLTKPAGSLGYLEELAVRYCLATNTLKPRMGKKVIFTFAGDHGVAAEGVSAYPKEVTPQMVRNMLAEGAAVNVLARHAGAEVRVVDIGVDDPLKDAQGLLAKKIRPGTANIAEGPAMTLEEARNAVEVGIELSQEAAAEGAALIGTGEMGIANTTPSSAIFAALLPCEVRDVTGRGTGIDDDTLTHKVAVIEQALAVNKDRLTDPLNTLAAVGGLEIAAICGLILGAASRRVPVAVDGFISSAGALVACRMCPLVQDYLFYSHLSAEAGHAKFFERLNVHPLLDFRMRLGEGTGAALAMLLIEAAVRIYNEMATFDSAGVSKKEG
ncbi:MAG: nicotinate-nucleotide--dimethylbenzimidazole phosphoribosyltransferase [Deltaproteobacteria bacterium]|mgnify:CR=1 FL=1|nr:MAG: nicotinate-nucleotide--dimethylbenzimidazole phosphoribosyltransferase [Deltaproteobacteria bacterium]